MLNSAFHPENISSQSIATVSEVEPNALVKSHLSGFWSIMFVMEKTRAEGNNSINSSRKDIRLFGT
jgi:hypothetical protein